MSRKFCSFKILLLVIVFTAGNFLTAAAQNSRFTFWEKAGSASLPALAVSKNLPSAYQPVKLDLPAITAYLASAPSESTSKYARTIAFILSLPLPDGSESKFSVWEVPVMAPGLSEKYPQIKTYAGKGLSDKTATLRFDITPAGMHAQILSASGAYYLDPVEGSSNYHISYNRKDLPRRSSAAACGFLPQPDPELEENIAQATTAVQARQMQLVSNGTELRTYRLALSCTGEYAAYHGGTVAGALTAMVVSLNRINGIYERELAVRMVLVENNDTLIFLNPATDPFSNSNGGAMLNQNQTVVDQRIGGANYDIGHVFSTGGGGIASLGVPCRGGIKAKGVTGSNNPIGDPFDVDYVAHEMGHQFGAQHTFNGTTGSCNGNRSSSTAYEPGSGSTIMAYAGICTSNNISPNSSPYFHSASFDQIVTYTTSGFGNTCPVITPTGNTPPDVDAGDSYYIPYRTPFRLTANAFDADGDSVTYCIEQLDLGPGGYALNPSGNAPIFRSFDPVTDNFRYFPALPRVVTNTQVIGELLPSYQRLLHFRVTARDNNPIGAVSYNSSSITVQAQNTGAPFKVVSPNTAVTWQGLETQTVTWDVAGTTASPIFTSYVNILLSVDGGYTFTDTLAAFVPNTGSYSVTVPNISTSTARIVVFGAGNIFFDISDTNFTITSVTGAEELNPEEGISLYPNPTLGEFNLAITAPIQGQVKIRITDLIGREVKAAEAKKGAATLNYSVSLATEPKGIYLVHIETEAGKTIRRIVKF